MRRERYPVLPTAVEERPAPNANAPSRRGLFRSVRQSDGVQSHTSLSSPIEVDVAHLRFAITARYGAGRIPATT
ncbi:hypothetical protein SAMN02745673_01752 [Marinactinospora thermotolerans DSM 45154]|uniref:Uncharacterized protein n=1 Tax=Marinactinospora thermotolerans DSM 45154 TaxID=1122192 RepID=A0A1T4PD89_9ACTN|nr:hypothetical protein SAMN02745673_01752 [Marinactinospora thermotolerans DSM 45154]